MSVEAISIEPELVSLKTKLTTKIENAANQIELLKKEMTADEAMLQNVKRSLGLLHPESKQTGYGSKSETIRAAIESITKPNFTQDDVEQAIKTLNPDLPINRNRIRVTLWTLQTRKELISVFTKGNNTQPAVYIKLSGSASGGSKGTGTVTVVKGSQELHLAPSRRNGVSIIPVSATRPKSFLLVAREAIQQTPKRFSTAEIFKYSQLKYPGFANKPTDFSNALWVLSKNKELEKLEVSVGHSPAFYRSTEKFQASAHADTK